MFPRLRLIPTLTPRTDAPAAPAAPPIIEPLDPGHSAADPARVTTAATTTATTATPHANTLPRSRTTPTAPKAPPPPTTLVFHQAALGDFVLLMPLLRALRTAGRHVTLVCPWAHGRIASQLFMDDAAGLTLLDIDLFEFTRLYAENGPGTVSPAVADTFGNVETAISFVAARDTHWCRNLLRLTGLDPQAMHFLPTRPEAGFNQALAQPVHLTEFHRAALAASGLALDAAPPPDANVAVGSVRGLILHPGAGSPMKQWPAERFEAVADAARAAGLPVTLLLGEAEAERWPADRLAHWIDDLGAELLKSTDALLMTLNRAVHEDAKAATGGRTVYLGNDSGPTHLAAALGLVTVALFGPTDPHLWRPVGTNVTVLRSTDGTAWPETADVFAALNLP